MVRRAAGDAWARPADVLKLLGLDERTAVAEVVRTAVDYATGRTGRPIQQDDEPAGAAERRARHDKTL